MNSSATRQSSKLTSSYNDEALILQNNYSGVRKAARKLDLGDKPNNQSSVPLQHRPPPVPPSSRSTQPNPTKTNQTERENAFVKPPTHAHNNNDTTRRNSVEQSKTQSNDGSRKTSVSKTNPSTKPVQSTTKNDIQTSKQSKPTQRRPPPPIPANTREQSKSTQNQIDDPPYANNGSDLDDPYELQDDGDIEDSGTFTGVPKRPIITREFSYPQSVPSIDTSRFKAVSNFRQNDEKFQRRSPNQNKNLDIDSVGLEINESNANNRRNMTFQSGNEDERRNPMSHVQSGTIENYPKDFDNQNATYNTLFAASRPAVPPLPNRSYAANFTSRDGLPMNSIEEESESYEVTSSFPISNLMIELGALFAVFILCMVLVLAIREDEAKLRTTMQLVYAYVYIASTAWMIWCAIDIIKFRRKWSELTGSAQDEEEYIDFAEVHKHQMSYYPDIHNTGGLFMRVGAGILCMGGLILTIIELAKTVTTPITDGKHRGLVADSYPLSVIISKSMTYVFRFIFHCVQYTFIFRYGNLIINHYSQVANIGLLHLIIANFCTWFEAIVFETLEQLHKGSEVSSIAGYTTNATSTLLSTTIQTITAMTSDYNTSYDHVIPATSVIRAALAATTPSNNTGLPQTPRDIILRIESTINVYLYPCLIEYSLISLAVFFIMWKNIGKTRGSSVLRFHDRHVFTVNCSRVSRGLVIGGIILLVTILTLIPTYLLNEDAASVTHITELVLLILSLSMVVVAFVHTTTLHHDEHAHIDIFDQALILITTVGDFAYSFFGLFASIFIQEKVISLPIAIEISIGLLAITQTFLQSGFILDTLRRRARTKHDIKNKPGREIITALLLTNLAIWLHDSLSAKKVRLNPIQTRYYDSGTWAIIQAFTSPLSIFYRFHSSVCLADIWHEAYNENANTNILKSPERTSNNHLRYRTDT